MSDEELRGLVRESMTRLRANPATPPAAVVRQLVTEPGPSVVHSSHVRFLLGAGGDETGACVIEPAVQCTHCGYCQSYGH